MTCEEVLARLPDLRDADLSGADLAGADLRDANLAGARIWIGNRIVLFP